MKIGARVVVPAGTYIIVTNYEVESQVDLHGTVIDTEEDGEEVIVYLTVDVPSDLPQDIQDINIGGDPSRLQVYSSQVRPE